jgi:hypothetical protein
VHVQIDACSACGLLASLLSVKNTCREGTEHCCARDAASGLQRTRSVA